MKQFIHRTSFLLSIVCLAMIPITIIAAANGYGSLRLSAVYFAFTWVFAIIHETTDRAN